MGWGVNDYPSPHEPRFVRCTAHGCDIAPHEDTYACTAKGCIEDQLCVGCTFQCADCEEDFCEGHVTDVATEDQRAALYVCAACQSKRNEQTADLEEAA